MARLINVESGVDIKKNIENRLKNSLGYAYSGEDSMVNIISDIVGEELNLLNIQNNELFLQNQISNAVGENIDRLAFNMYGINRIPGQYASSTDLEKNVYFYTEKNSFGEVNAGESIIIPAGTYIGSQYDLENSKIRYVVTKDVTLEEYSNIAFVSVRAENIGSEFNADTSTLVFHDFEGYADSINRSLLVENRFPIINGSDEESDNNFKYRISTYLEAVSNKNYDLLSLRLLEIPGVYDFEIIPSYYGIGTTGIVLFGAGREISSKMLGLAETKIAELRSMGENIYISEGIDVFLDFDIRFYYKKGMLQEDVDRKTNNFRQKLFSLIKSQENFGNINLNEISNLLKEEFNSKEITGFGSSNSNNIFENMFYRKSDKRNLLTEEKMSFKGDYFSVNKDERIRFGIINIIGEEDNR